MEVYRLVSAGTIEELSYMNSLYKQQLAHAMTSAKSARASHFAALHNADQVTNELFSIEDMMCYSASSLLATAMHSSGTSGSSTSSSSSSNGSKGSRKTDSSSGISNSTAVIAQVKQEDITAMFSCAITSVAVSITATTAAAAEAAISSINSTNYKQAASSYDKIEECVSFTDMMLQQLGVADMLHREPLTSASSNSRGTSYSSIRGSSDSRSNGSGSSRSADVHKRSAVQMSDSDSSSAKLSYTKARSTKRCKSTASNERHKRPQQLPYAYGSRKYNYNQHRSARNGGSSDCRGSGSSSSNARHSQKRRAVHNRDSDSSVDECWTW
jgi:hypothetical protein